MARVDVAVVLSWILVIALAGVMVALVMITRRLVPRIIMWVTPIVLLVVVRLIV
jgi:hypothetical protein